MTHYDVFNGDADGLCSLHQLRLDSPRNSTLVTGVKRDIALLSRVEALPGDSVTVLDVSLEVNHAALVALLDRDVSIDWFDHHYAGDIPDRPKLRATIDRSPEVCTGVLVDRHLAGRQRVWAVVAAFGDNLAAVAQALAQPLGLSATKFDALRELGDALAYNAYGDTEADLIVHPASLYRTLSRYADPFAFMRDEPQFARIVRSRHQDLAFARATVPEAHFSGAEVYVLPDAAWSRRVRGTWANALATRAPTRAHAILTPDALGGYVVSVRAPLARPVGAERLCRKFPTGGGRSGAAGINHLPRSAIPEFLHAIEQTWQ